MQEKHNAIVILYCLQNHTDCCVFLIGYIELPDKSQFIYSYRTDHSFKLFS